MIKRYLASFGLVLSFAALALLHGASAQPTGPDVQPGQNSIVAQATDTITVEFSSAITPLPSGTDTISVLGSRFGSHTGETNVGSSSIEFISDCLFRPGETVTATVPGDATPSGQPFVWQFTVRSEFGTGEFEEEDPVTLGTSSAQSESSAQAEKTGSVTIPSEPYAGHLGSNNDEVANDLLGDVAVVNQENDFVEIRYGPDLGDTDSRRVQVPGATTLAGGDIDGDGFPDLVTANTFDDELKVVMNDEGEFREDNITTISTGARPTDIAIADLDGDGAQDLAVTPFGENRVYVHLNEDNGLGEFQAPQTYNSGRGPSSVVVRDIDNDGDLDLLVGSTGDKTIEWLENDGAGGFASGGSIPLGFAPATLVANDVAGNEGATTGDGWIDLIVSAQSSDRTVLYENDSTPSFNFSGERVPTTSEPVTGTTLADVDGAERNYDLDLVSTFRSIGLTYIFANEANNGYSSPTSLPVSARPTPTGVVGVDVDRDEGQDIVAFNTTGKVSKLFRNQGGRPGPVTVDPTSIDFDGICVGDDDAEPVQIENISNNDVVVAKESIPPNFSATGGALPDTLSPGETKNVSVTFSPEEIRDYNEQLVLRANELTKFCGRETEPVELPIAVEGTGEGTDLSTDTETREFGEVTVGNSSTESFAVRNGGNIDAENVSVEGLGDTPFEVTTAPSTIPSRDERQVTVEFSPDAPNQDYDETLRLITSSDCGPDTVEVALTGSSRPQRPDLVAEQIVVEDEPTPINISDELDVACEFSNQGGTAVEDDFTVRISRDGNTLGEFSFASLSVGGSDQTGFETVIFEEEGPTEATCEVDPAGAVNEGGRTDNNEASRSFDVETPDQLPVSPNPFTPNGDGINDVVRFKVAELGLTQPTATIYTFEGRAIQTLDNLQSGELRWDGTDDSGQRQPPGVYLYVVREGGQSAASGQVTLAR